MGVVFLYKNCFSKPTITALEMILTTLRYMATGSFLIVCGDLNGVDKGTVSRMVHRVVVAIPSKLEDSSKCLMPMKFM